MGARRQQRCDAYGRWGFVEFTAVYPHTDGARLGCGRKCNATPTVARHGTGTRSSRASWTCSPGARSPIIEDIPFGVAERAGKVILVDTSVWIDDLQATGPETSRPCDIAGQVLCHETMNWRTGTLATCRIEAASWRHVLKTTPRDSEPDRETTCWRSSKRDAMDGARGIGYVDANLLGSVPGPRRARRSGTVDVQAHDCFRRRAWGRLRGSKEEDIGTGEKAKRAERDEAGLLRGNRQPLHLQLLDRCGSYRNPGKSPYVSHTI